MVVKAPQTAPATARSMVTSSKTTMGSLPPSSNSTGIRCPAAFFMIWRPTAWLPMRKILSGFPSTRASPTPAPLP